MKHKCTKGKTAKAIRLSKECRPSFGRNVVEHTALRENPPNWKLKVKYRDTTQFPSKWIKLQKKFPNANVVEKKTNLIVDLNEPQNPANVVLAAFGTPGSGSRKRTQLITFSKHFPEEGRVEVSVLIIDDTENAFEGICARQEAQGKYMLAPMAVLFVGAEDEEDVKVQISDIEAGWKLDGAMEKVFAFQPILNSAELDMNDIPSHCFVFKNTNTSKSCLSCKITATHTRDKAVVDVLKSFKTIPRLLKNVSEDSPRRKRIVPRPVSGKIDICTPGRQFACLNVWLGLVLVSLSLTKVFLQIRECRSQKLVDDVIPAWQAKLNENQVEMVNRKVA